MLWNPHHYRTIPSIVRCLTAIFILLTGCLAEICLTLLPPSIVSAHHRLCTLRSALLVSCAPDVELHLDFTLNHEADLGWHGGSNTSCNPALLRATTTLMRIRASVGILKNIEQDAWKQNAAFELFECISDKVMSI